MARDLTFDQSNGQLRHQTCFAQLFKDGQFSLTRSVKQSLLPLLAVGAVNPTSMVIILWF